MNNKQLLVKAILENALSYKWSLQGLGMLRLYLSDEVRLHVWDTRFAFPNVSSVHTHPWNFHSEIVVGRLRNFRYEETTAGNPYNKSLLHCGEGGCLVNEVELVRLTGRIGETYEVGSVYTQQAHEIHYTVPSDGTVTIVTREFLDDKDYAFVYWPEVLKFGMAEPRPATPDEIQVITSHSLKTWFK